MENLYFIFGIYKFFLYPYLCYAIDLTIYIKESFWSCSKSLVWKSSRRSNQNEFGKNNLSFNLWTFSIVPGIKTYKMTFDDWKWNNKSNFYLRHSEPKKHTPTIRLRQFKSFQELSGPYRQSFSLHKLFPLVDFSSLIQSNFPFTVACSSLSWPSCLNFWSPSIQ